MNVIQFYNLSRKNTISRDFRYSVKSRDFWYLGETQSREESNHFIALRAPIKT